MNFDELYHFLFETYTGVGILVASCLVLCVLIAIILEWRTRRTYVDRGPKTEDEDDEWSIFDDDEEEGESEKEE